MLRVRSLDEVFRRADRAYADRTRAEHTAMLLDDVDPELIDALLAENVVRYAEWRAAARRELEAWTREGPS